MEARALPILSVEEYLDLERTSDQKYEFHDGYVVAMAGGTRNHVTISGNAYYEMRSQAKGSGCTAYISDMKIHVLDSNSFHYPDAMLICGEAESSPVTDHALINPSLMVEVLSDSSESRDRGSKFHLYQRIPTLREYVLIDQHKPLVDVFRRQNQRDLWKISRYEGLRTALPIQTLNVEISLADLYTGVSWHPAD